LNLSLKQILHATVIHGNQNQVRGLAADLEAEGTAGHADKHRRAPAVAGAARDHALAVLRAHEETRLSSCWEQPPRRWPSEECCWERSVIGAHDLVQNHLGRVDAALQIFARRRRKCAVGEQRS
jgi:hypothetical protein